MGDSCGGIAQHAQNRKSGSRAFSRSKISAQWIHARGAPQVRGDAMIRRRASTNHTQPIHSHFSLRRVVKRADAARCDACKPAIGFSGSRSSKGIADFEPKKTDYRPARVTMRGVGAFDDTPEREIPSRGRWYRVSRGVAPSHRVAAHLWCGPCVKMLCKNTFFWVPKSK